MFLIGVAEQQGRKDLVGTDLVEKTKALDLYNADWIIEPHDISIEQLMAETFYSKVFLAACRRTVVAVKVPKFNRSSSWSLSFCNRKQQHTVQKLSFPLVVSSPHKIYL